MSESCPMVPLFEFDDDISLITAAPKEELMRGLNGADTCIMTYMPRLEGTDIAAELDPLYRFIGGGANLMQYMYKDALVVANLPAGASMGAALMEEMISLGVSRFICCGSAGLIDSGFDPHKLLVVTDALRDEGTSYHYLPAGEDAYTSPLLRADVKAALDRNGIAYAEGRVWTTDAIYRETPGRVERRRNQGCVAVDMATSALCAVSQFRGVEFAQMLYFSNHLFADVWSGYAKNYGELRLNALHMLLKVGGEIAGV